MRARHLANAGRRRTLAWLTALLAFSAALVTLHVRAYPTVSPFDELQHLDYLIKVSHGQLVHRGDHFGTDALHEESCRGLDYPFPIPDCTQRDVHPEQYQEGGFNTAYIHPPTYYLVGGLIGRAGSSVLSLSQVTVGRLVGALWLAGALLLLWMVMAELSVPVAPRVVVSVLIATAPTVLHISATINNDGSALLCGAAVLWAVLRWEQGRSWVWPALAAALCVATKSTNAVAVLVALTYVAIRAWQTRSHAVSTDVALDDPAVVGSSAVLATETRLTSLRQLALLAGGMAAAMFVIGGVWLVIMNHIARVPSDAIPMVQRVKVSSISFDQVVGNLPAGETPLQAPYIPAVFGWQSLFVGARLVNDLFFAAVVAVAIGLVGAGARFRALAAAVLVSMFVVGPLFVLFNFVVQGTYTAIPARYGLSLVPGMAVAAAGAFRHRVALWAAGCVAVLVTIATLGALVSA